MPPRGCSTALIALSIVLASCGRGGPTLGGSAAQALDVAVTVPDASTEVAAPDTGPPSEPDQWVEDDIAPPDPFPDEWVASPPDWCEKPEHQAVVKWTFDGDTFDLNDGTSVRLIGVDAPEIKGDECWSLEARDLLRAIAYDGAVVCLREDITSSPVDPYGRLLRYVFIEHAPGKWGMINARLVRLGAAPAFHKYLKGKVYEQEFEVAEEEAYAARLGGWAMCDW